MRIRNITKNTCLAEEAVMAQALFKRMKGLLGQGGLKQGQAMVLKPCNSIHTFFMAFAIDVLFLDKENRVVKALDNVSPFRISGIYLKAQSAIELPAGTIQATSTSPGDVLLLE